MGEYCGAETALAFTSSAAEFTELLRGCAVFDLGGRAHFKVSGQDRVRWLNGMVSNNIRELPAYRGNYNFVLTPQGHIQGDLYVYSLGEYFLAGTEVFQLEKLLAVLRRYIIMDKVELADLRGQLTAVGVQGPGAREVIRTAGFGGLLPQAMQVTELSWQGRTALYTRRANEQVETYEIWLPPAEVSAAWDALTAAGAKPVGTDALEMLRVSLGIPRYGQDIRERDLPQETSQMQALSFTKGCYVGQEIVERIRSRGAVHRNFTGFTVRGAPPSPGTKIQVNAKEVGEITSALAVPALSNDVPKEPLTLALGYIRREAVQPGDWVEIGGAGARVSTLPFPEIFASELTDAR
jgi:folate-binding protein YgfZ